MGILYGVTIFLSAFLLFQVQPVIAKIILPWFGGSSAVWSTCMLFFQSVLLLGYLYAHWLHQKVAGRRQAMLHVVLLAGSVAALPIMPNAAWKAASAGNPAWKILALLTVTIGLPYFVLSSTSPLVQAWYARTHKGAMPYRLFALSNAASMLALLSYPVVVEPNLTSRTQVVIWSAAYAGFVLLCGLTAWLVPRKDTGIREASRASGDIGPAPGWAVRVLWVVLAGCASVLLLSVTTFLTQDVAAIPFLWILPLSAYLLTFILCFESPRLYRRSIFVPLLGAALVFMAWRLWPVHALLALAPSVALVTGSLFVVCMVCHGELVRRRPSASHLTAFYVSVSLGGALGGIFVGLVAPVLFNGYYELHLGLGLCAALAAAALWRATESLHRRARLLAKGAATVVLSAYLVALGYAVYGSVRSCRVVTRNFYGQLRVRDYGDPEEDADAVRTLVHGLINHGEQMLRAEYRRTPIAYFCPQSGIGRAMRALEGKPRRVGILGLGCGTLAAYGRAGDLIRIYEINPQVIELAESQFTYLSDTPARRQVVLGDARLALESEPSQQFDLLVMDAFSGDSLPIHLITREAFLTYFRHLKPDGIVAIDITNKYLNLRPVIAAVAAGFHETALVYDFDPGDEDSLCFSCNWALIMDPATAEAHPELQRQAQLLRPSPEFRAWTDDFSNLFGILK